MEEENDYVPNNQVWLYNKLEELREPSFATIYRIVVKVQLAMALISLMGFLLFCLFCALVAAVFWGSFAAWGAYLPKIILPSYNFLP